MVVEISSGYNFHSILWTPENDWQTSCTKSSLAEHLAVSDCFTNQNCNASCAVWMFTRQHEPQGLYSSKGAPVVQTVSHAYHS